MINNHKNFRVVGVWALAAMLAMTTAPGFGNSSKKESSESAAKADAAATPDTRPQFELGPSLKGRYDLTVFLGNERVDAFQFQIADLRASVGRRSNWVAQMSLVLEFGAGTGVAECGVDEIKIRETIRAVLLDQQGQQLLTTAGKLKLKQELISILNASLKSARVRQIYLTEFTVSSLH